MIAGIKAAQDQGKTSLMVSIMLYLVKHGGYLASECFGNLVVRIPGYNALSSDALVAYLGEMVEKKYRHKIILLDEVDRIFSHRFWNDRKQTESLLGLWQDMKLFNTILWTAHLGNAVDVLLRETTQIELIPRYIKEEDRTVIGIISNLDMITAVADMYRTSKVFPFYDRWATVD